MNRLLPDPGPTTVADQYSHLRLVDRAHRDRPYLVTNFALTVDGRAQIDGRSGPIGELRKRPRGRGCLELPKQMRQLRRRSGHAISAS